MITSTFFRKDVVINGQNNWMLFSEDLPFGINEESVKKKQTIIQELNEIFSKRRWDLLPLNNEYDDGISTRNPELMWVNVIRDLIHVDLHRDELNYDKHREDFTKNELDLFVVEFIKPICLKYNIKCVNTVDFIYFNITTLSNVTLP